MISASLYGVCEDIISDEVVLIGSYITIKKETPQEGLWRIKEHYLLVILPLGTQTAREVDLLVPTTL
jgi:hypothetical protein